jgi:hypothetical protein
MSVLTPDLPKVETAIIEMTNAFRRQHDLAAVAPNEDLTRAARAYAQFLAKTDLFSHTADGRQPAERTKAAGYAHCQVAENLALNLDSRGFATGELARDAVEGWKASPGHRKNMLAPHVTDTGVAVAKASGEEKYVSVQLFGRPRALAYKFTIENAAASPVQYSFHDDTHTIKPSYTVTMTACLPGEVAFFNGEPGKSVIGRYTARDGQTYLLRTAKDGGIKIEVSPAAEPSRTTAPKPGTTIKR